MNISLIPQILVQYETDLIKRQLYDLPAQIKKQKEALRLAREEYKDVENNRLQEEALLMAGIVGEVDSKTGKPVFSNDKARASELIVRKKLSEAYRTTEQDAREAENKVASAQFELERLQDEFKSYRYVADMTARELALYVCDVNGEESQQKQAY